MRVALESLLFEPHSLVGHTPIAQLKRPVLLALEGEDRVLHEFDDLLRLLMLRGSGPHEPEAAQRAEQDARRFWPDEQRAWLRARDLCDRRCPGATGPLLRARDIVQDEPYMRALLDPGIGPLTRKPFTSAQIEPVEWDQTPRGDENDVLHRLLVRAALDGFHARAQTLLDMRADPAYAPPLPGGDYGYSALMVASRGGDRRMLQVLLLSAQPRHLGPDHDGVTPLIGVAHVADLLPVADAEAMLRLLLEAKAAPNLYDRDGYTALARLVHRPTGDTLRLLACLHAGGVRCPAQNDAPEPPHAPLAIAAATGREDVVRFLLTSMGADVLDGGAAVRQAVTRAPLMAAVAAGHPAVVRWLVEFRADPADVDLQGNSAFHMAARHNHGPDILNALMGPCAFFEGEDAPEQRAIQSPNLEGQTALMVAVHHGHARSARALMDVVAGDDERRLLVLTGDAKRRHTPLHRAASMGHEGLLTELLRHFPAANTAEIDVLDRQGQSPLERALAQDELGAARLLLGRGARVTPRMLEAAVESLDDARLALLLAHTPQDARSSPTLAQTWLVYRHRLGASGECETDAMELVVDRLFDAKEARSLEVAVACGARAVVARLVAGYKSVDPLLCHLAAYNLDHALLRTLWIHCASLPLAERTAQTERTPLCCALAQLARTLVGDHTALVDEALRFVLDDTAAEARALVETRRSLRFEAPAPVMVPLGRPADGVEAARLLLTADAASARAEDARGRNAGRYWEVCVAVAKQFHQPAAFLASLLALGPLFPPGVTMVEASKTLPAKRRRTVPTRTP